MGSFNLKEVIRIIAGCERPGAERRIVRPRGSGQSKWAVIKMVLRLYTGDFRRPLLAPHESRFEKIETGPVREGTVYSHFGTRLRKVFPVPPESSEPGEMRRLLQIIRARLDEP